MAEQTAQRPQPVESSSTSVQQLIQFEQQLSDKQIIELIDFSVALDYDKKLAWRKKLAFLRQEQKQKLIKMLLLEKRKIKESLIRKMKGLRGYYFARSLNDLEKEFLTSL